MLLEQKKKAQSMHSGKSLGSRLESMLSDKKISG